jgi:hypothetical protein
MGKKLNLLLLNVKYNHKKMNLIQANDTNISVKTCDCSNYLNWECPKCGKLVKDKDFILRAMDGGSVLCCGKPFHYCKITKNYSHESPIHDISALMVSLINNSDEEFND